MKPSMRITAFAILSGILALYTTAGADAANGDKPDPPIDVRALLEKGLTSGSLPEGVVVRIGACMGEADATVPADAQQLVELWEFTSHEVYRVTCHFEDHKPVYDRHESCQFDSKDVCKDLLDGRALEINERKGTGPEIVLAGTHYGRGSRSIEVELNGRTLLDLHETNGAVLDAYRQTDAQAFGSLYERLAAHARALLGPKAGGNQ